MLMAAWKGGHQHVRRTLATDAGSGAVSGGGLHKPLPDLGCNGWIV